MAVDTGYPVSIAARRLLGQNARPRDGQPASGLEWWQGADLCDTARPEMGCAPPPPLPPAPEAPAAAPLGGLRPLRSDPGGTGAAVLRPLAGRGQGLTAGPGRADRF
jgi:hypothetical protein